MPAKSHIVHYICENSGVFNKLQRVVLILFHLKNFAWIDKPLLSRLNTVSNACILLNTPICQCNIRAISKHHAAAI